ncbi:hypothetical protein [Saccharothrix deserti]|nr:hypothetical protein [Saccharothrix deserti]
MDESELLASVQVTHTAVVHDRAEVQASDGGSGDWGENRDP